MKVREIDVSGDQDLFAAERVCRVTDLVEDLNSGGEFTELHETQTLQRPTLQCVFGHPQSCKAFGERRKKLQELIHLPFLEVQRESLIGQPRQLGDCIDCQTVARLGSVEPPSRIVPTPKKTTSHSAEERRFTQEVGALVEKPDGTPGVLK